MEKEKFPRAAAEKLAALFDLAVNRPSFSVR
jgi:hypothetical protein